MVKTRETCWQKTATFTQFRVFFPFYLRNVLPFSYLLMCKRNWCQFLLCPLIDSKFRCARASTTLWSCYDIILSSIRGQKDGKADVHSLLCFENTKDLILWISRCFDRVLIHFINLNLQFEFVLTQFKAEQTRLDRHAFSILFHNITPDITQTTPTNLGFEKSNARKEK